MSVVINGSGTITGATTLASTVTSPTLTTPVITSTLGVGNATPSGSGSGITFPATQSASTDANTLDDYEEGTWTPAVTNSGFGSGTFNGTYTKIGRLVTVTANLQLTSVGTASGGLGVSGLPFSPANQAYGVCRETVATGVIYYPAIDLSTSFNIQNSTNGAIVWTNGYIYRLSITYVTST